MSGGTGVALRLEDVHKRFGRVEVLRGIDLEVAEHEVVCLIGASGSGKSTLLRCINRIEDWQRGRVIVDGTELTEDLKAIDEVRGEVGMVFQQFNLFPHLTVLSDSARGLADAVEVIHQHSSPTGGDTSAPTIGRRSARGSRAT